MFSKRLLEIASLVPVHSTVVDVGCDHALLDIYLTLHRNCNCTASDINENCLKSARENIKKYLAFSPSADPISKILLPFGKDLKLF